MWSVRKWVLPNRISPASPKNRHRILLAVKIGLIIGLLSGGAALAGQMILDRAPKNVGEVEANGLYRSGLNHPDSVESFLADKHIQVIISLTGYEQEPRILAQEQAAQRLGISIQRFPLRGTGLPRNGKIDTHVAAVAALLKARQQGKCVLVQCAAGANRTGGVIAIYQLLAKRMSGQEVYREMADHKWDPHDNAELLNFLNSNMRAIAEALCREGVLDRAILDRPIPVIQP